MTEKRMPCTRVLSLGNSLHEFHGAFSANGDDHVAEGFAEKAGFAVREVVL